MQLLLLQLFVWTGSKAMSLKESKPRDNNNEIQQTHDRNGNGLRCHTRWL